MSFHYYFQIPDEAVNVGYTIVADDGTKHASCGMSTSVALNVALD